MASKKRKLPEWLSVIPEKPAFDKNEQLENKTTRLAGNAEHFNKIMDQSLPEFIYKGSIVYSYNKNDCSCICEEIWDKLNDGEDHIIGFDMEWPVSYRQGSQPRTALLQLCTGDNSVFLFQLSCIGVIPSPLKKLLLSERMKKVGVGIESDLWKLEKDYEISVREIIKNSMIDLSVLANKKLKSKELWSLDGLTKNILKAKLNKNPLIRKSDWSLYPLSEKQQTYAATDAYVGYVLHNKLRAM